MRSQRCALRAAPLRLGRVELCEVMVLAVASYALHSGQQWSPRWPSPWKYSPRQLTSAPATCPGKRKAARMEPSPLPKGPINLLLSDRKSRLKQTQKPDKRDAPIHSPTEESLPSTTPTEITTRKITQQPHHWPPTALPTPSRNLHIGSWWEIRK